MLDDAGLGTLQHQLDQTIADILALRTASGKSIGRRLPKLLQNLRAHGARLIDTVGEISRFTPPDGCAEDQRLVTRLASSASSIIQSLIACLAEGWADTAWTSVRQRITDARAIVEQLRERGPRAAGERDEDPYAVVLGIPARMLEGEGLASRARFLAAWTADRERFDRRLRRNNQHLLDHMDALSGHLRHHLAALGLSEHPLLAHRAAIQSRDLVARGLRSTPKETSALIARHVALEPDAEDQHHRQVEQWQACLQAEDPRACSAAAMRLYLTVVEGEVGRTVRLVLQLLGRDVPERSTLGTLAEQLQAAGDDVLCELLDSLINLKWRNAAAHEQYRWDEVAQVLLVAGEPVELIEIVKLAIKARAVCRGIEHGIAVAYGQNPTLVTPAPDEVPMPNRTLTILEVAGVSGLSLTDIKRDGGRMMWMVPDLVTEDLRRAARALLAAGRLTSGLDVWEIRQTSSDRPIFTVDSTGMQIALRVAEPHWDSLDPLPFAELPLIVNAVTHLEQAPDVAMALTLRFASAHVLGERGRLSSALMQGQTAAQQELIVVVGNIAGGVLAASEQLTGRPRRMLQQFGTMLTAEVQQLEVSAPASGVHAFTTAERAFRKFASVDLPWIPEGRDAVHEAV